ncbi:hypothetical protein ACWCQW_25690 [Streptomyces mirabilis]
MSASVFFPVRLRQRGALAELMSIIERFTPVAQPLAPSAAVAQVGGVTVDAQPWLVDAASSNG